MHNEECLLIFLYKNHNNTFYTKTLKNVSKHRPKTSTYYQDYIAKKQISIVLSGR